MSDAMTVPFDVGQNVVLGVGPTEQRRWLRTHVKKVDGRMIWLDGEPTDQPVIDVLPGQIVACHTWRSMDALYAAEGRITFVRLGDDPLVGLTIHRAERIQQREYVRVPLSVVAHGFHLGTEAHALEAPREIYLNVHDLSASGLRGRVDLPLTPGDLITFDLSLPRADADGVLPIHVRDRVIALPDLSEPLHLRAIVVRLVEGVPLDAPSHEIGAMFLDTPRAARERIIRFALDVQRDRRRRGKM